MFEGDEIDLGQLPVQTCWPGDAGPLITWGLVVTRGPQGVPDAARAAEPGHLPPAGDRPAPGHHALAGASRRRARLPRLRAGQPGPAVSDRGGAGRRPGDDPRRGDAGARHAVGVPVRRPAARQPHRGGRRVVGEPAEAAGAGQRRDRARGPHPGGAAGLRRERASTAWRLREIGGYLHALEGPFGDHTGYYNEQDWFPVFEIDAPDAPPRPDLPLDLHRQAARRAGGARRGAERGLRADPAEAVSGDRRLLPAARRLQLPAGDRQHPEAATRATPSG